MLQGALTTMLAVGAASFLGKCVWDTLWSARLMPATSENVDSYDSSASTSQQNGANEDYEGPNTPFPWDTQTVNLATEAAKLMTALLAVRSLAFESAQNV